MAACAGSHFWLADARKSPLAIRVTVWGDGHGAVSFGRAEKEIVMVNVYYATMRRFPLLIFSALLFVWPAAIFPAAGAPVPASAADGDSDAAGR